MTVNMTLTFGSMVLLMQLSNFFRLIPCGLTCFALMATAHADPVSANGRVVDTSGRPIEGATVICVFSEMEDREEATARTNANGEFIARAPTLETVMDASCLISAPQFGCSGGPIDVHRVSTFVMRPPTRMRGKVVDLSGAPVAGAKVFACIAAGDWPTAAFTHISPSGLDPDTRLSATTQSDGTYAIGGATDINGWLVLLDDPAYYPVIATVYNGSATALVARPAGQIRGHLSFPDGSPAVGWHIRAVTEIKNRLYRLFCGLRSSFPR